MRIATLAILFLLTGGSVVSPLHADEALERVRGWVVTALQTELAGGKDMNKIASLVYPLTDDVRLNHSESSQRVLAATAEYLRELDVAQFSCGALVDFHLVSGFLAAAGIEVGRQEVERRLQACDLSGSRFDLANALLFYCRYTSWSHAERLPGGLQRLPTFQREDGAFVLENGRPWYYLTSHALLALHYCGGEGEAVRKAQQRLVDLLPRFLQHDFVDGLVESLIFLRWTQASVPEGEKYASYLKRVLQPTGGVCFVAEPDCQPHWHATSLLFEWLLQAQEGQTAGALDTAVK